MQSNATRTVEYAEWNWGLELPRFCATTFHHTAELIRLVSGQGDIYVNGERYALRKGDLYVMRPLTLHSMKQTASDALVVDVVKLDLRRLAENCPPNANIADYLHFLNDKNAPCALYGDSIRYNAERVITPLFDAKSDKEKTQRAVYDLLRLLHKQRSDAPSQNITEERQHFAAQTAVEYLSTNYTKQIKVSDVAEVMGYDEYYAMKLFKRFCGWSIVDYLNGVRATAAKELLISTTYNSKTIAERVGYKSASYFNRQFKKAFGITPMQLRLQTD